MGNTVVARVSSKIWQSKVDLTSKNTIQNHWQIQLERRWRREITDDGSKEKINKASKDVNRTFERADRASKEAKRARENSSWIGASKEAWAEGKGWDRGGEMKKEKGERSFEQKLLSAHMVVVAERLSGERT
jgi:hypothetical protein